MIPRIDSQMIVEALALLRARSCIVDGEAVSCGEDGIASFDRIRHRHYDGTVFLYAFDLIELDGEDLRRDPLEVRKATLASMITRAEPGIRLNEHLEDEARSCSVMPASSAWKASSRSARIPATAPDVRRIGSSRRIRRALRLLAKPRKIGGANSGCQVPS
jgi:hypothetical protein